MLEHLFGRKILWTTYIVEINVGTAVVGEDKVSDGIGALDGKLVAVKGVEEPGILVGDKLARFLIRP